MITCLLRNDLSDILREISGTTNDSNTKYLFVVENSEIADYWVKFSIKYCKDNVIPFSLGAGPKHIIINNGACLFVHRQLFSRWDFWKTNRIREIYIDISSYMSAEYCVQIAHMSELQQVYFDDEQYKLDHPADTRWWTTPYRFCKNNIIKAITFYLKP